MTLIDDLRRDAEGGMTRAQSAAYHGISQQDIYKLAREHGLPFRNSIPGNLGAGGWPKRTTNPNDPKAMAKLYKGRRYEDVTLRPAATAIVNGLLVIPSPLTSASAASRWFVGAATAPSIAE